MRPDPVHRIGAPDHAGRRNEDVVGIAADRDTNPCSELFGVSESLGSGGNVRVLGYDDDRPQRAVGDVASRHLDARSREP